MFYVFYSKICFYNYDVRYYKSSAVAEISEMGDRGHNRHGPKRVGRLCPFRGGELGPRLTQCDLG